MNATVTMPVSDLDTLRDKIKELTEVNKHLESVQKQVKLIVRKKELGFGTEYGYNDYGIRSQYYKEKEMLIDQPPVYINFEEVKEELKERVQTEFIEKIGSLERSNINLQKDLETQKQEKLKSYNSLVEVHKKNLEGERESYTTIINGLEKEIKVLKGELVDLGKDEEIKQLKQKLKELQNKSFFKRLFNL